MDGLVDGQESTPSEFVCCDGHLLRVHGYDWVQKSPGFWV